MFRSFYFLIAFFSFCLKAQRNAEAEGFCQPFLTSPHTSPLSSNSRNIAIDEEGEFYCELVLQDRFEFHSSSHSLTCLFYHPFFLFHNLNSFLSITFKNPFYSYPSCSCCSSSHILIDF